MEISSAFAIKIALVVAFFSLWVIIEETIIDRHGLWKHLPFYKVGIPCLWDIIGAVVIIAIVALLHIK